MLKEKEREALQDYYHNKELYTPANDPAQETPNFKPQEIRGACPMCGGGCVGECEGGETSGYSKGGPVKMDEGGDSGIASDIGQYLGNLYHESVPPVFEAAETLGSGIAGEIGNLAGGFSKGANPPANPGISPASTAFQTGALGSPSPQNSPTLHQAAPLATKPAPAIPSSPLPGLGGTAPNPIQFGPQPQAQPTDQYQQLIAKLLKSPTPLQRAGAGISELGSGIMQGVARAGPGEAPKNIEEARRDRLQALNEALRNKFGTQMEQSRLNLDQQRLAQEKDIAEQQISETEKARQTQAAAQAQTAKAQTGEAAAKSAELGQSARGWFGKVLGLESPQYTASQKVLQGQTQPLTSPEAHAQAIAWAKANPADPRSAHILQMNGQ